MKEPGGELRGAASVDSGFSREFPSERERTNMKEYAQTENVKTTDDFRSEEAARRMHINSSWIPDEDNLGTVDRALASARRQLERGRWRWSCSVLASAPAPPRGAVRAGA